MMTLCFVILQLSIGLHDGGGAMTVEKNKRPEHCKSQNQRTNYSKPYCTPLSVL